MSTFSIKTNANEVADVVKRTSEAWGSASISAWFRMKVHPFIKSETMKNFDAEGRPRWFALSTVYGDWKAKHFPGKKILERTGNLKKWLSGVDYDTQNNGYRYLYPKATNIEQARIFTFHQAGTGKMRQRQIVGFQSGDDMKIGNSLRQWIEMRLKIIGWK
jgi:phage gpG-like protein